MLSKSRVLLPTLALAALLGTVVFTPQLRAADSRYNVLFIAVDDLRPELGCYPDASRLVRSPNIDNLAASGLRFDRAYCQFALCNPSRSSLLTGRRPETLQVFDLKTFVRKNNPGISTLPELFKNNGYETRSYGKIFHAGNGNHDDPASWSIRPWHSARDDSPAPSPAASAGGSTFKDESDPDTPDHSNDAPYEVRDVADEQLIDGQIASRAVAALRQLKGRPFFLAVGFHRPHLPFVAPRKYWDWYRPQDIKLAANPFVPEDAPAFASNDSAELRRYKGIPKEGPIPDKDALNLVHGYYACVSYVDAQIGRLLKELERLSLRSNTVVILWGDHGYQLGEHATWTKRTNWEIATRAPLLISVPNQKSRRRATDALVEFVDIYPTLAELCRLPLPLKLEGTSFVPLLQEPARPWKTAAFSVYTKKTLELGNGIGRAMRTDRYRLVEWTGSACSLPIYELYDHREDPLENVNQAKLPANKRLLEELAEQLHAGWQKAVPPQ
jgi:iduronate 2-sulfatase